ncbi:tRNA (guanine(26)-N(2))-dimethyltransferase [Mycena indigotica]|uniref:tRNA (guanine(26)-N(2))-dimethyltransferase n=1 Tax=Mycena indigotica TaxID=2126181 RepID=A0A8H6SAT5_9AGAR|nr:tRNA (guanine(26)-N(2))-dimethyltransferase [Mycena indigotica]KAF7294912.1 tRNA (guanine(26)-N(2))-dimethyltransferase [Mycena indigotica]
MADNKVVVPEGFTLHTENTSHILLSSNETFLNPVQEFNRDLSVACITTWSQMLHEAKQEKWMLSKRRKEARDKKHEPAEPSIDEIEKPAKRAKLDVPAEPTDSPIPAEGSKPTSGYSRRKIVILEALSATGLRSIRYAKEIPYVSQVIANDLSPAAAQAIKRNVEINGLTIPDPLPEKTPRPVEIKVNEGDAWYALVNSLAFPLNFALVLCCITIVKLINASTASIWTHTGLLHHSSMLLSRAFVTMARLLCVTCTDLSILATTNFAEKCFSNYGGIPTKSEYCHEAQALRLVLHTVSTSAARYGRFIEPLLCLSIDFYVRLFIRVRTSPIEVKRAVAKTSIYWICNDCQSFYGQPMGKVSEKAHPSGPVNVTFKTQAGPPVSETCPECNGVMHAAGPMWSAPIHNQDFVSKVLEHVERKENTYGTVSRMKGMLTVAKEELPEYPFYFTPAKISKFFHCVTPSFTDITSALLHAGHKVARSHASAGSIKTSATRSEILDIFRCWVKSHPIKSVSPTSPAHRLLSKEPKSDANFTKHPQVVLHTLKIVRYPEPPPNWGPKAKAMADKPAPAKRKHVQLEDMEEQE